MQNEGPLTGLLVVDLSRALAGPHAGMILGDLGADVIKVESDSGDESRHWGPPFVGPDSQQESTYFLSCNRNKRSIVIDMRTPEGAGTLLDLVRRADVLIENFRPGVMERLGFGPEQLLAVNPRLVVMSISGFGHDGPERDRAGYDQIAQGEAGLMSVTGSSPDDPQRVGVPIADLLAGLNGVIGAIAALYERSRHGRGKIVRTSLLASVVGVHAFQGTGYTVADQVPHAQGNHHPSIAPYGLFHCADGAVQLSVGSPKLWEAFCSEFGLDAADPLLATNESRVDHRSALISRIEDTFRSLTQVELLARLRNAGIPSGLVRTMDEVYRWDQVHSQRLLREVHHSTLGTITLPGSAIRFFDSTADGVREVTPTQYKAPPMLGEHTEEIVAWLATNSMGGAGRSDA